MASVEYKAEKLTAKNYITWKTVIKSHLMSKDLWEFVVESKNNNDEQKIKNEAAKHLMYVAMEPNQIAATGVGDSAHDLWVKIKENHEGAESNLRSSALADFLSLKYMKNESLINYAGRYELALGKLTATSLVPDEETKLWVFSNSLPQHMKLTVQMFAMAKPEGKVSELISHLKIQHHLNDHDVQEASAFNTNEGLKINKKQNQSSNQISNEMHCSFCKNKGHSWKECRKLKAVNARKKKNAQINWSSNDKPAAFNASTKHEFTSNKMTWIVDSGASNHMTPHKSFLTEYKTFGKPKPIVVGNGEKVEAYGVGNIKFRSGKYTGILQDVLWVPKLTENLFSVIRAMKMNCDVKFNHQKSSVNFYREQKLVLEGKKREDSVYFLLYLKPDVEESNDNHALLSCSLEQWHKKLSHCSKDIIKQMVNNQVIEGMKITQANSKDCQPCIQGKICRANHPSRSHIKADESSAVLHIDVVGPMKTLSLGGSKYYTLATEEFSKYMLIETSSTKATIPSIVKLLINKTELESGRTVKAVTTDNGSEFTNIDLQNWLFKRGTIHYKSVVYTPEQNGLAERTNRTILDGIRTLLSESKLTEELWAEAAKTVVYTLNRVISKTNTLKTRYELFFGKKPNLANLKIFGQEAIIRKSSHLRESKLAERGEKAVFVGYTGRYNTFRFYSEEPYKRIIEACDVKFLEAETKANDLQDKEENIKILEDSDSATYTEESMDSNNSHEKTRSEMLEEDLDDTTQEKYSSEDELIQIVPTSSNQSSSQLNDTKRVTRSQSAKLKEGGSVIGLHKAALFTLLNEPKTLKEAKDSEEWSKWEKAILEEISALENNQTWVMVDKPNGIKPIKNKWVFRVKVKPNGEVDRYKARLVAKGYSQIPNVDYTETYAPTASMTSIRMLLAVANQRQMHLKQFDIQTAFLNGDLQETLYMEPPEGYGDQQKVCKLKKGLYGLKQAPRNWNQKFDQFLKQFNLMQSKVDKCIYYNTERTLLLAIYVDDGLAASTDESLLNALLTHLKKTFSLKTLTCETFLGLEIQREGSTLSISQRAYIDKLLDRFAMVDCKTVNTPEQVGAVFTESKELDEDNKFKELVGGLLYLSTCSRPDITHSVSIASRTSKPTKAHWAALKRILRYLKGSRDFCIRYDSNNTDLIGYSDADYANDEYTRRSTTGFCIYYGGAPIVWKCQKQPIITLSTTEAEYVAGCELVKTLIPIREQLIELKQIDEAKPTKIYIDNQSTVKIANDEKSQSRTKHIDIRQKWLSEQSQKKTIAVEHIRGEEQAADLLTKPLHKGKFIANRARLLTLITMVTTLLAVCSQARDLRMTDVLNTVPSDYVYIQGDTRFKLTNVFINPCEKLFSYSSSLTATESLIKHCIEYYDKKIMKSLPNCDRLPTIGPDLMNVPLSYDCVGNGEAKNGDTGTGRCKISKTQVKDIKEAELERVNSNWNKHKKKVNTLPVLRRNQRALPFLAVIAMTIYATGSNYFTGKKVEGHSKDIDALMDVTNNHTAVLQESVEFFEKYRDSISAINTWAQEVEDRLGNEEQESRFVKDPLYKGKRAHLVRTYMSWFDTQEKLLNEINVGIETKKIPTSLLAMLNHTSYGLTAKYSSLYDCNYHLENGSMVLNLDFSLPTIDKNIEIFQVVPMNFYTYNRGYEDQEVCWTKYHGPLLAMHNKTSACLTRLHHEKVFGKVVRAQTCAEPLDDLHSTTLANEYWHQEDCQKYPTLNEERIQIHEIDGVLKIYCHPFNIEIDNTTQVCPNGAFIVEGHATFKIGNITHHGAYFETEVNRETKNFNSTIQSRSKRSPIPELIITAAPIVTTTATDKTEEKSKPNIVTILSNMTGAMNASIDKIKNTLKSIPKLNITQTSFDSIFTDPFNVISHGINALGDYFKNFGETMGLIGLCLMVIMIVPALEVAIIGAKILKVPINLWLGSAKRVTGKISSLKLNSVTARRKRWDDGGKIV